MSDPRVRFLAGADEAAVDDVVELLDTQTIRITGRASEWRHQTLLLGLVDLLGRIFPRLDVAIDRDTPAAAALPPGGPDLGERLDSIRARSPLHPLEPTHPALTVHVGPGDSGADVYVDGSEWQSYVGSKPSRLPPPRRDTAIGPLAAACRAGARVFAKLLAPVLAAPLSSSDLYVSGFSYRCGVDPINDGDPGARGSLDALLVGGGSVGGAAAYALAYEPEVVGRLIVCDPEPLDATNPFRSVLATVTAAANRASKVEEIKHALAHHRALDVDVQPMSFSAWEASLPGPRALPLVLVAVDRRESRERIQDALPLEVVNAAVGADLVSISGHRTGSGPCMCCLHMPEVLDSASIKNRLIADATGFDQKLVNELRVRRAPLEDPQLRHIERHRNLQSGALARYTGITLDELYVSELLYGETQATTSRGTTVAVAAPFVTALAGVLLAGEALKRSSESTMPYALGDSGSGIQYRENPYVPEHGYLDSQVPRSAICLCRSVRRLRVLAALYGLELAMLT